MTLEGSVRKAGKRLRITAQLVKVKDGYHLWSERYDRDMEDVFKIQDEISLAIVDRLKVEILGEEMAALVKRHTEDVEAYNLYLKGRYHWNKRTEVGFKTAIEYFTQAIENDSAYSLAFSGLADCYSMLVNYGYLTSEEAYPKAKTAAEKALKIDDTLAEAHTSLAWVKQRYDWDWLGADKEYRRAIDLNTNYSIAHHWWGLHLAAMCRLNEAAREMRRAQELDPLSASTDRSAGEVFYYRGQYDRAIEEYRKSLETNPNFPRTRSLLGAAYARKGMHVEAIEELRKAMELPGQDQLALAFLAYTYAVTGEVGEARKLLRELKERAKREHVPSINFAWIYTGLDEQEIALQWLEKAGVERSRWVLFVRVDPAFEGLRSVRGFEELLQRMGFPAA